MPEQKQPFPVSIAIIIAGVLISGALLVKMPVIKPAEIVTEKNETHSPQNFLERVLEKKPTTQTDQKEEQPDMSKLDLIRPVDEKVDHVLGNPNAPIKIVEYSDMDCQFCERFHTTMQRIMTEYEDTGKVAWVYRHFPLDRHIYADREALGSECIAQLGGKDAFWSFVSIALSDIYSSSSETFDIKPLVLLAGSLGVSEKKFTDCMTEKVYLRKVLMDTSNAVETGAQGTPWTIIMLPNGKKEVINGAQSYGLIKDIIERSLKSI